MSDDSDQWADTESSSLFSMRASDNAEVVPEDAPVGTDSMWTTETRHLPPPSSEPLVDADHGADEPADAWWTSSAEDPTAHGTVGGVFSAEPVDRSAEVLDATVLDPGAEWEPEPAPEPGGHLFTNGATAGHPSDPASSLWRSLDDDPAPRDPRPRAGRSERPASRPSFREPDDTLEDTFDSADTNGYEHAVRRLDDVAVERAAVPLAVCGALLDPDEVVLGVVTGQMLGRSAAVVVTSDRVLIANDRRWQPLVDVYDIGPGLTVRGRHDREVAALNFTDGDRISMVDGITDVQLAIELAEAIRSPEVEF